MKTQRGLIVVMTALVLSLLSLCIMSPAASSRGGSALGSLPRLKAVASALEPAQDKTVRLVVRVKDDGGKLVPVAHVNVYQEHRNLSSLVVRPPDYQQDTNTNGIATFQIAVKTGEALKLSIEVSREDMQTAKHDLDRGTEFPAMILEQFTLKPRPTAGVEGGSIINVSVNVQNDKFDPVEGATVLISGSTPSEHYQGMTGPKGNVIIPVGFVFKLTYKIEVSKQGHEPGQKFIELDTPQVGKTVFGGNITIEKAAGTVVTVSVRDQDNPGQPVADAKVTLDGAGHYPATTDGSGTATLFVPETGTFTVKISQEYYEPFSGGELRILVGEESKAAAFSLKAKAKKEEGKDTIEVTVLASDPTDEKAKPLPLAGAVVKTGRTGVSTNGNGHATLNGSYEVKQEVTAEATGYKSQTKTVGVTKLARFSSGTGSTTFILVPELSESSPIRLIVEVNDSKGGHIKGADVGFYIAGRLLYAGATAANGETDFRSGDRPDVPLSELRQGLTIKVKREGYKEVYSSVPADLLKPSNEARRYSVQLEKDWSALTAAIAALEPRVAAWNGDAGEKPSQSMLNGKIELALLARKRAEELSKEIEAAREVFGIGLIPGTTGASCRKKATQLKEDIQICEAEANQKAQELKQILDGASIIAANCSSPKDGDTIKNEYGTAIKLLAEIGKRNKKAVKDRDDLLLLAQESLALKTLLAEMQNKVAEIGDQANAVAEVATSVANEFKRLADISKSLMAREIALNSELAVLEVKYNVNTDTTIPRDLTKRVDAMRQLLGSHRNDISYGKAPEASLPEGVSSAVTTIDGIKNNADHLLRQYQAAICEIDTMDQMVDGINTTLTNATFEVGLAADLPNKAEACINCQSTISEIRALLEEGAIDPATAKISKARTQGCDVSGLDEELAKAGDPNAGESPTNDVPAVLDPANAKTPPPTNDAPAPGKDGGFWDAAKTAKKDAENKIATKSAKGTNPAPTAEGSPTDDVPAVFDPANAKSQPPTDDVPAVLDPGNAKSQPPTDDVPEVLNPSEAKTQIPTDDVPSVLDPGSPKAQPTDDAPGVLDPGNTESQPSTANGPRPKKERKPKDPNAPSKWKQAGELIGAVLGELAKQKGRGRSGGQGGTTNPGGGTSSPGEEAVDLSGTWEAANIAPPDSPCRVWIRMSLQAAGEGTWTGPETAGNNCPANDLSGAMIQEMFKGFQGDVTVVTTYPGRLRWTIKPKQGDTNQINGSYTKTQIFLAAEGGTVTFVKK